ncbi:MAG: (2Fe-2S)-binding protein [candidate division KSB1 bacterium]|nr:(2Fe-2S)-binding protein [candidate division KSB1 bacterium]MDZ7334329.1 (2Fe-2S)-binding protein [candidate division KSB1 bacterium]MDZ7356559.1 (2Fe-2S)-binding protein [candidate division KSB1 bacterium]MDZ7375660.1 (2Fe-2S)-binding protein [candidate division KSB1 bacterium]MDZ7400460.1 (2Fe-2S)-binding protein [candidate division KSB1 bacterium]
MEQIIKFKLNRRPVSITVDGDRMLLWVLRTDFGLTGAKYGCGEGFCGSCTVLVDGQAVRSCQTPVKAVQGREVITIEGLARNGKLHPLQEAFMKHDAMQCGFCTPGMILNAYSLLRKNNKLSVEQIKAGMEDNLCRCGAHPRIVEAILDAAAQMKGGKRR